MAQRPKAEGARAGVSAWAARAWVVLEDRLYPALGCSPVERTLYNHLLRHTLLEGRRMVRRTKTELSRATGICGTAVRDNLRALEAKACVRIRERAKSGLLIEVFPPGGATEAPRAQSKDTGIQNSRCKIQDNARKAVREGRAGGSSGAKRKDNAETQSAQRYAENSPPYVALGRRRVSRNLFKSMRFRRAVRRRERGWCFYCQRRLRAGNWGLDHVVSRARGGGNDARNAAACCVECNRQKGEMQAEQFLVMLRREGRISGAQLKGRLAALRGLACGRASVSRMIFRAVGKAHDD